MAMLSVFILLHIYTAVLAAFCKKEFFYHQYYSYGYDIYCNNLDNETMSELTETVVYNEIKLRIEYSDFRNTNWHIGKHLPKLREVTIEHSHLDDLEIFTGLKNLNLLKIEDSTLDKITIRVFQSLEVLQKLIFRNNSLENSIFASLQNLDTLVLLNLNNNKISGTLNASTCRIYNLNQIYLQHNNIERLGDISCLKYTEELYLDFNSIIKISTLEDLPNLKVLSLSNNNIEEAMTLTNLYKLEVLNLEKNEITILDHNCLRKLAKLKQLNLKQNRIHIITDTFFMNVKSLKYINLANNSIDSISLQYLPLLEELNLSSNRISSLKIFSNSTSLKKLDVSSNNIRLIDQYVFSRLSNVTSLNLSENLIENNIYDGSFFGLINLENLQLQNISTSYIPEGSLAFNGKLKILNLSKNKMQEFGKFFERLINVEILNISHNNLQELEYVTIKNMLNLRVIDVEGNALRNVEYKSIVMYLHKLVTINVKNNKLSCDFLSEMISFFNYNYINYTINEEFQFDKENVAGIYCKEITNEINYPFNATDQVLKGNTLLLNQLVNITKKNKKEYSKAFIQSVTYATVFSILIMIVLSFSVYRGYIYLKRRHYCSDEFELIDRYK